MTKDYSVLLIQLDRNLASNISTRCCGRPQGILNIVLNSNLPNNTMIQINCYKTQLNIQYMYKCTDNNIQRSLLHVQ